MPTLASLVLWLRRLRVDRLPLTVLGVTVLATAFLAASGPLLAVQASASALRDELARATDAQRNLVVSTGQIFQFDGGTDAARTGDRSAGPRIRRCAARRCGGRRGRCARRL